MIQFTKRQQQIIDQLIKTPDGISAKDMAERVNTSRRTIYREFENLELILFQYKVPIIVNKGIYKLNGEKENIEKFSEDFLENQRIDNFSFFTSKQRQSYIICELVNSRKYVKFQDLSFELSVSITTIQNDITLIESILEPYKIEINTNGQRAKITGEEEAIREIIVDILSDQINDYELFENIRDLNRKPAFDNFGFMAFLSVNKIKNIEKTFEALNKFGISEKSVSSDNILKKIILLVAVTKSRVTNSFVISKINNKNNKKSESISRLFESLNIEYTNEEAFFLNEYILKVLNNDKNYDASYSDYDLVIRYKINNFVKDISQHTSEQFILDNQLLDDLQNHIGRYIEGTKLLLSNVKYDSLENIKNKNEELFILIGKFLKIYFSNLHFNAQEQMIILFYFVNSSERKKYKQNFDTLIIYSESYEMSKLLIKNLRKSIPQLKIKKSIRLSEINENNLDRYSIILSTTKLPGFDRNYKIINSLLFNEDIREIEKYVGSVVNVQQRKSIETNNDSKELNKIFSYVEECKRLLNDFLIEEINNSENFEELLKQIIEILPKKYILNKNLIYEDLFKKLNGSRVGVPNSNVSFFHGITEGIEKSIVAVFELKNPVKMVSMNLRQGMYNRIVFVLGTTGMEQYQNEILSNISSSIIEEENLSVYGYGSQNLIKNTIEKNLYLQIKENLGDKI